MAVVTFEIRDQIAFITLNRPEKLNSFTREMALLLQNRLDECASLHEVRAVYLTGAGKAFSAGQDLAEVTDPNGPGLASWPGFSDGKESYMEFGDQIVVKTALRKNQLDFLTGFSASQRARNSAAAADSR